MPKKQSSPSSQVQQSEPKKEENKPVKKYTAGEAKKIVSEFAESMLGTQTALSKYADKFANYNSLGEKEKEEIEKEIATIAFAFGVETGLIISSCAGETFQKLAFEMKKELEKEFDCRSISEKALVDLAVGAYIRNMSYTWRMDGIQKHLGRDQDGYRNYLSREIDRSHRHYISAIETLRAIKQPLLKVNIKTNNAFVGEKQQFNDNRS